MISIQHSRKAPRKGGVVAIIPARGGSKGIPRKNTRLLCGKPLIAYTIETALKSTTIDHVVVSTEDEEIAEISRAFGAQVPFLRPKQMAGDHANLGPVTAHAMMEMRKQGVRSDIIVNLYPTSPFRTPALVDHLVGKMVEGFGPVRTVKAVSLEGLRFFARQEEGGLMLLREGGSRCGKAVSGRFYRAYGLFLGLSKGSRPYLHLIKNPMGLVDIDAPEDFFLAEEILRRGLFDFNAKDIFL